MMTTFRTVVAYLPPTPLGLIPGRWIVEHRCTVCHEKVAAERLIVHAQSHAAVTVDASTNSDP